MAVRCPTLVGRDAERDDLLDLLDVARCGGGRMVVVTGEEGMGKSRLLAEVIDLAAAAGVVVLTGVASMVGPHRQYQPLIEAMSPPLQHGERWTAAFRGALAGMTPTAEPDEAAVATAFIAGLRELAADDPVLVVLEDLQWADDATVRVMEAVGRSLDATRVLVVCSTRPDPHALMMRLTDRLTMTNVARSIALEPLPLDRVTEIAQRALGVEMLPPSFVSAVRQLSAGVPRIAEAVVSAAVASGALVAGNGEWLHAEAVDLEPPATIRRDVLRRVEAQPEAIKSLLATLSLTDLPVDLESLAAISGRSVDVVASGLRSLRDAGFLTERDGNVVFVHGFIADIVAGDLLSQHRSILARSAVAKLAEAAAGLPAERLARLAAFTGDDAEAAAWLLTGARSALAHGDLAAADALIERGLRLAAADDSVRDELYETRVAVLALGRRAEEAIDLGTVLLARLPDGPTTQLRRIQLHIAVARAGLSGRHAITETHLQAAMRLADDCPDGGVLLQIEAVYTELVAQRTSDEALVLDLARRMLDRGRQLCAPDVVCRSLELIADRKATSEPAAAIAAAREGVRLARKHDLRIEEVACSERLATFTAREVGDVTQLREVRDLAVKAGAVAHEADIAVRLGFGHLMRHELQEAKAAINHAESVARHHDLDLLAVALAAKASLLAIKDNRAEMEQVLEEALSRRKSRTVAAVAHGNARAISRLIHGDEAGALDELGLARSGLGRDRPSDPWMFLGLERLLRAVALDSAPPDVPILGHPMTQSVRGLRGYERLVDAVALGHDGDACEAEKAFTEGDRDLDGTPWYRHHARLLLAESAINDGWGEPAPWLREGLRFFENAGHDALVKRCKKLLQVAGASVPRRGRGDAIVSEALAAVGVTSREMDVLQLVVAGLSNAEIAARLFVSPKTVKTHIAHLLEKTGAVNRAALAEALESQSPPRARTVSSAAG